MSFGYAAASALAIMREEKKVYKDYLPPKAIDAGKELVQETEGLWEDVLLSVISMVKEEIPLEYPHVAVWWYSVLIGMKKDPILFHEFVQYVRDNRNSFTVNTQYFLFHQLASLRFRFSELDGESKEILWRFYMELSDSFAEYFPASLLEEIPPKERNEDLVLVITEQFIAIQHGPTKTALDRCKAIITKLGKRVLLINDAEVLSLVGMIPFFDIAAGNYMPQKMKETIQKWKGVEIPYCQCENNMPDIETMEQLLREIRAMAPGRIITIGRGGMLAQLAGRMVPMLTVGLCPSEPSYTCAKYQTLSRPLTTQEVQMLRNLGYGKEHIIESIFTSSLKPQTEHITRKELGEIPDHAFLLIVVGARLDTEVTKDFLSMLEGVLEQDMYVGFLGTFAGYQKRIGKFPKLQEQSGYLGFCQDILSRLEVCDLYVNPTRKGGGTSCVEALYKGVPVVSVDYGDVAINAGEAFCVKDYRKMQEEIRRYHNDKDYYKTMSQKARERAKLLLDTDREFIRIMKEMDRREQESGI